MSRPRPSLLLLVAGIALLMAGGPAAAGSAPAEQPGLDLVKVQGIIDPTVSSYVRETLEQSERDGATVVLQIDSRGSFDDQAERLGEFLRALTVPVVAWVGPTGARAEGGALFLLYGASLPTMAPGAGIGPARPFDVGVSASREDPQDVAAAADRLVSLASGGKAEPAAVRALVSGAALPAGPAQASGAVALVASDLRELMTKLDGRTVGTASGEVTLHTLAAPGSPAPVRFHEMGPLKRVLHAAATPTAVYVLMVLGLWAIVFELTQPGMGVAGIAGVLALAMSGYGLSVIPVWWPGIGLIVAGMALQGLDVLIRRVALLTIGGTLVFAAGSALAWWTVAPAIDLAVWLIVLFTVGGALYFGFGLTVALRSREQVRSAQVGLVGLVGETRTDLDPVGGVYVKGAIWRARSSDGTIPKGTRVRVRGIDGLVLRVEPDPE